MKPVTLKLEYDTPQFLQGLFANDRRNLSYLDEALEVKTVTRDGWISFTGAEPATMLAKSVFDDLESTQRNGLHISDRDFRLAVDIAKKSGDTPLNSLSTIR